MLVLDRRAVRGDRDSVVDEPIPLDAVKIIVQLRLELGDVVRIFHHEKAFPKLVEVGLRD